MTGCQYRDPMFGGCSYTGACEAKVRGVCTLKPSIDMGEVEKLLRGEPSKYHF